MRKNFLIAFILCTIVTLVSCESYDGDWDPMEWKTSVKVHKNKKGEKSIVVPPEGGTFVFHCKNYECFWIGNILVNGEGVFNHEGDFHTCQGDWGSVECKMNKLTVKVSPATTKNNDVIGVSITAGDIWDFFQFERK